VACLFDSYFWDEDKRKGIKRSYLQALKHMCRCFWALISPLWDVKKTVARVQNPEDYAQPKGMVAFVGFIFFLVFFVGVPISNSAADFNFAGDLLAIYNADFSAPSFLSNPIGNLEGSKGSLVMYAFIQLRLRGKMGT